MRTILTITAAALLFGQCATAEETSAPHVTVFGTATTEVEPDMLKWNLAIENRGPTVSGVAEEHTRLTDAVVGFLKQHGIERSAIQTSYMSLGVHRVFRSKEWVEDGYKASTIVSFTSKDLTRYKDLWLGLSELRGISIRASRWDSSQRIEIQNRTRDDALKAAREKAERMAAALGAKIGAPLAIEEVLLPDSDVATNRGNFLSNNISSAESDGSADDGGIAAGKITVRIRVQVTFGLAQR